MPIKLKTFNSPNLCSMGLLKIQTPNKTWVILTHVPYRNSGIHSPGRVVIFA